MIKYVVKRFAQMIVVLFIVSLLVFLLTNFIGDPVDMLVPENATLEQIESARARLGLDKPLPVQYGIFIRDVLHGNFGKSYIYGKPAMDLIFERMPATLELVAVAACLVLCIAIPLGVYAGAYPKRASSKLIMSGSILGISLPSFWVGMMMIYIFAVVLFILLIYNQPNKEDYLHEAQTIDPYPESGGKSRDRLLPFFPFWTIPHHCVYQNC